MVYHMLVTQSRKVVSIITPSQAVISHCPLCNLKSKYKTFNLVLQAKLLFTKKKKKKKKNSPPSAVRNMLFLSTGNPYFVGM